MHLALLLLIIIILFIILSRINIRLSRIEALKKSIEQLKEQVAELNKRISSAQFQKEIKEEKLPSSAVKKPVIEQTSVLSTPEKSIVDITREEVKKEIPKEEIKQKPIVLEELIVEQRQIVTQQPAPVYQPVEGWFEKWLRNSPDIEKFIGENLINKIGIAILVLGIAFFVKYAIDQNWINEVGRVCIGLVCGLILISVAHRLRKSYRSFSSVLVGGGLAVFYFTIAFAFHQYHLISQSAAFIIMVVITAFAVILSVLYDRIELAILATIGGFITPFLVSTGEGNYIVLFTYLCILNSGLIALAFYKRWHILNFIAFVFTVLIYGGWIVANSEKNFFSLCRNIFIWYCFLPDVFNNEHNTIRDEGNKIKCI